MSGCLPVSEGVLAPTDESVKLHPPFESMYRCSEHWAGQLASLGDALGTDCTVARLVEVEGRFWLWEYENAGASNEDWYGWNAPVLAPCDCVVTSIHHNPNINSPGIMGEGRASSIRFLREDGLRVVYAHVREVSVNEGDRVRAGDPVARVGNNGFSRSPHIHIGAWIETTPLQIRFDQKRM